MAALLASILGSMALGETKVNDSPEGDSGVVLPGPDGEWIVR